MFKIPKGQKLCEQLYEDKEVRQIVTSNQLGDKFYLYNIDGDNLIKIETANTPKFKNRIC